MSVLVSHFTWSLGTFIVSFHLFLSGGMLFASGHVLNPIFASRFLTVFLQVSLGWPLFPFPSVAHVGTVLGNKATTSTLFSPFCAIRNFKIIIRI